MERVNINHMPFYSEDGEKIIAKLSAYKISHIVPLLSFYKPSLRYPNRLDRIKSDVLRALCDRYPNVWPGVAEIAKKAKCSPAQARRVLRELELKDRLIVDINSRLTWRWPTVQEIEKGHPGHVRILESDNTGKEGGSGKNSPVQYFICDRKIYDLYTHQQEWEAREKREKYKKRRDYPNQGKAKTQADTSIGGDSTPLRGGGLPQSGEEATPIRGSSNQGIPPSPLIAEPISSITDHKEPASEPTTTKPGVVEARAGLLPKEQNQTPKPALLERMAKEYAAGHDGFLNLGGKQKILDLCKKHGEETVEQVWNRWLTDRDLDGLICPLIVFADEFPHVLEDLERIHQPNQETVRESFNLLPMLGNLEPIHQLNQEAEREEQEGYAQIAALNVEAEMEAAVVNWTEALQAVAEITIPNIEGCEPGTDKWEHELREWVKRIPPPVLHLNSLDWRADETFEMVIEKGKTRYEHVHDPSRRAAAVAFGVLTQQQADGLAAEAARYSKSLPEPGLAKGKTN